MFPHSFANEYLRFFAPYGVTSVRLRRAKDGTFKGSCFVEFENEEGAQQFLEMEEKPKFEDNELQIMSKKAYVDMKMEGILDGTVKPNSPTRRGGWRGGKGGNDRGRRGSFNGGYNKRKRDGDNDDDDVDDSNWRERRERFQKNRGRKDERDDDRSPSRSRSPYREEKKDAPAKDEAEQKEAPADAEGEKKVEESAA